jgi:hypothetical protein
MTAMAAMTIKEKHRSTTLRQWILISITRRRPQAYTSEEMQFWFYG